MSTAFAQTGAQSDDAEGVPLAGDRADQRRPVDGVGDRAVDDRVDADLFQHRHPLEDVLQHRHDPFQIVRTQRVDEMRVDPVHPPALAVLFIEADQQALLLLPRIEIVHGEAQ